MSVFNYYVKLNKIIWNSTVKSHNRNHTVDGLFLRHLIIGRVFTCYLSMKKCKDSLCFPNIYILILI